MRRYAYLFAMIPCAAAVYAAGCGSDDAATVSTTDAGADGASSVMPTTPAIAQQDASLEDAGTDASGGVACHRDEDCLSGTCLAGSCFCEHGTFVQPSGVCGATAPPSCRLQEGACVFGATCSEGLLHGTRDMDRSCGDVVAETCCFDAGACRGSTEFRCCPSIGNAKTEPVCINGWTTCQPEQHPAMATADGGCPDE